MNRIRQRVIGGGLAASTTIAVYLAVRPRLRRWGATADEWLRALPGDDLVATPRIRLTQAITIASPPLTVWAWLAVIGRRGWFWPNQINGLPEIRRLTVGDVIPVPGPDIVVLAVDPEHVLLLGGPGGTLVFVLEPSDGSRTRLLMRMRMRLPRTAMGLLWQALLDPVAALMSHRLLRRIKQLAEHSRVSHRASMRPEPLLERAIAA